MRHRFSLTTPTILTTLAPKRLLPLMILLCIIEGITVRHRFFIGLVVILILAMFTASLTAAVPPPGKMPRIGVLWFGDPWNRPQLGAFRHALRERGWVDGQNLRVDQLPVQAAELVQLPVDVIIATSGPATMAAQQATRTIPMVMMAGDPIGQGWWPACLTRAAMGLG